MAPRRRLPLGAALIAMMTPSAASAPAPRNGHSHAASLVGVNAGGTFTIVAEPLDRPTSLELIGNTAYVVTFDGQIWKVDNVSAPPFGIAR